MVSGGTVTGDLSSIKSCSQSYTSEIGSLSGTWKGPSHDNLVTKAEEFISEYTSAIEGEMTAFASACDLYQEYDTTKKYYNVALSNYNQAVTNKDSSAMTTYGNQTATYSSKLNQLKSQIESLLSTAKAVVLQASSSTGTSSFSSLSGLGTPSYGTFEKQTFTASNGLKMTYYLYMPDYGTSNVSGLPVMLYMHGGGNNNSMSSLLSHGLSKAVNTKSINPSGIVVIPFIANFSDKRTVPALKELVDDVVTTYQADSNRISVSGHSSGAITSYKLVNSYPDTFAAMIPISGFDQVTEALKNVKVWAFNGKQDTGSRTSWKGASETVDAINQMGGSASLYTYEKYGHAYVQDFTYEREFESPDGDTVSPLEWAFRQTKNS